MRARLALLTAATLLPGCASLAGGEDPVAGRVDDIDGRVARLERVAGGPAMLELVQRIDALEAELRSLRGQVEVLENGNEALRRQQRQLYADLERRLAALEGRTAPGTPANPAAGAAGAAAVPAAAVPAAGAETPEAVYGRAFDALKAAGYPVAIAGMKDFLARYPTHELADNAQYWLGESYYVTRDYDNAIAAFGVLGQKWPDSPKAGDALLKIGYSHFELKRYPQARQALSEVGRRFPGTDAARLAQERLKRIP